jgi:hypothetical protein
VDVLDLTLKVSFESTEYSSVQRKEATATDKVREPVTHALGIVPYSDSDEGSLGQSMMKI